MREAIGKDIIQCDNGAIRRPGGKDWDHVIYVDGTVTRELAPAGYELNYLDELGVWHASNADHVIDKPGDGAGRIVYDSMEYTVGIDKGYDNDSDFYTLSHDGGKSQIKIKLRSIKFDGIPKNYRPQNGTLGPAKRNGRVIDKRDQVIHVISPQCQRLLTPVVHQGVSGAEITYVVTVPEGWRIDDAGGVYGIYNPANEQVRCLVRPKLIGENLQPVCDASGMPLNVLDHRLAYVGFDNNEGAEVYLYTKYSTADLSGLNFAYVDAELNVLAGYAYGKTDSSSWGITVNSASCNEVVQELFFGAQGDKGPTKYQNVRRSVKFNIPPGPEYADAILRCKNRNIASLFEPSDELHIYNASITDPSSLDNYSAFNALLAVQHIDNSTSQLYNIALSTTGMPISGDLWLMGRSWRDVAVQAPSDTAYTGSQIYVTPSCVIEPDNDTPMVLILIYPHKGWKAIPSTFIL